MHYRSSDIYEDDRTQYILGLLGIIIKDVSKLTFNALNGRGAPYYGLQNYFLDEVLQYWPHFISTTVRSSNHLAGTTQSLKLNEIT